MFSALYCCCVSFLHLTFDTHFRSLLYDPNIPQHLILLHLINLILSCEQYKLRCSSLSSCLQRQTAPSAFGKKVRCAVLVLRVQYGVTGAPAQLTSIHIGEGTATVLTIATNDLLWYN
jgi:hypothetical protein